MFGIPPLSRTSSMPSLHTFLCIPLGLFILQAPISNTVQKFFLLPFSQHVLTISAGQPLSTSIPEVRQLELLCKQLYESQDSAHRAEAEKALVGFQNAPDTLSKCQLLLDRGDSCYAQLLAATTLTKLVSRSAQGLSLQQRVDIRNYVLNYLATQPKLPNFVIQALVTLFARISKLGWFDSDKEEFVFRNVVADISKFLQKLFDVAVLTSGSVEHCMVGVQLLSQLTCEMNQISEADANRSLTKHRKIASSFRDTQLFEIFRLSCSLLGTARENCKSLNFSDEGQHGLMTQLLRLAHNCLTFDFIGTSTDESSDDLCTVQIPTSWRPAFLDFTTLKLFFDLYHSLPNTLSPLVSTTTTLYIYRPPLTQLGVIMFGADRISTPFVIQQHRKSKVPHTSREWGQTYPSKST
ncbi:unnamed protein product, partial [Timema podura]|nr:unnamed protein product [Timema podura]